MNNQPVPVVTQAGDYSFYAENLSQCIKTTYQFNGRLIHNICDGGTDFIANGFWDYAVYFILLGLPVTFILALIKVLID